MTNTPFNYFDKNLTKKELQKKLSADSGFLKAKAYFFILAMPQIEEKTKGGIILARESIDMSSVGNNTGRIVSIGKGVGIGKGGAFDDLLELEIGDYVGYSPHSGIPRNFDHQIFLNVGDDAIRDQVFDITRVTDGIFRTYDVKGAN